MGDAPHGPLIFGLDDVDGGGGGGSCTLALPMTFGNQSVSANAATRFLSPAGELSGTTAQMIPVGYTVQTACTLTRLQIAVNAGAGNGGIIDYDVLVNGISVGYIVSEPSTFSGVSEFIGAPVALVDGDVVTVAVLKIAPVGTTPTDVQAFLRIEQECGGGGGDSCCSPTYIGLWEWQGELGPRNLNPGIGTLDYAASLCGQGEPLSIVIRGAYLDLGADVPLVLAYVYSAGPPSILRVNYDATGVSDNDFVIEITNDCGCCTILPLTLQTG